MSWRSCWDHDQKEAYKAGIRKGRRLEREDLGLAYPNPLEQEEIPFMCQNAPRISKVDQVIEQLNKMNHTLSRIENRQIQAAAARINSGFKIEPKSDGQLIADAIKEVARAVK